MPSFDGILTYFNLRQSLKDAASTVVTVSGKKAVSIDVLRNIDGPTVFRFSGKVQETKLMQSANMVSIRVKSRSVTGITHFFNEMQLINIFPEE